VVVVRLAVVILALAAAPLTRWMYPELTGTPAGADLQAEAVADVVRGDRHLVVNAVLCWLLYEPLGVAGVTLSMATVSAVNFVALFVLLRRDVGRIGGRGMAVAAAGPLACAAALALVSSSVWWALSGLSERGFWGLLAAVLAAVAAAAVCLGLAKLLRLEELSVVRQVLRRRRRV